MKQAAKKKENFDSVAFMREQRNKLSKQLSTMTKEEIIEIFTNRERKPAIRPRGK